MGHVDEEASQGMRMRMSPPMAIVVLTAPTPHLLTSAAPPDSTPRPGVKVTKTSSEQNSNRPGKQGGHVHLFKSPLSDFEKEIEQAGLGEKVIYLKHGDQYEFYPDAR